MVLQLMFHVPYKKFKGSNAFGVQGSGFRSFKLESSLAGFNLSATNMISYLKKHLLTGAKVKIIRLYRIIFNNL